MRKLASLFFAFFLFFSCIAAAGDQIIRPAMHARTSAMGGVKYMTGLYSQNFFGNPARSLANPDWRFDIFDITADGSNAGWTSLSKIIGNEGGSLYNQVAETAGDNNHLALTANLFSVFWRAKESRMSFGIGLLTNYQLDARLRNNFEIETQAISDIGLAFNIAKAFLKEDKLKVGINTRVLHRLDVGQGYGVIDFVKGNSLALDNGADGLHLDFDVGATYDLPWHPFRKDFKTSVGLVFSDLLGGEYKNLKTGLISSNTASPRSQPRALALGFSGELPTLWKFKDFIASIEFSDIFNHGDGSFFRLFHFGTEATAFHFLKLRLGINQGYYTFGIGFDLKVFELDYTNYGEELSLNSGGFQDRRHVFHLSLKI